MYLLMCNYGYDDNLPDGLLNAESGGIQFPAHVFQVRRLLAVQEKIFKNKGAVRI
jgi:hypothetical protein